jgi:hypothetical protein
MKALHAEAAASTPSGERFTMELLQQADFRFETRFDKPRCLPS